MALVFAAPVLHKDVHLRQFLANAVGVGCVAVHLVDGENHGNLSRLSVVDRLLRLWHDAVVRCHHDDGQIGHLSTTGTHGRERFVTWRVKESDFLSAVELHRISTDVLGDATRLTSNDVGLADKVE